MESAITDRDGDGMSDAQEYLAGTDPTNARSALKLQGVSHKVGHEVVITWSSVSNKFYAIEKTTNLSTKFSPLKTNILATPVENVYTDSTELLPAVFYRIKLE